MTPISQEFSHHIYSSNTQYVMQVGQQAQNSLFPMSRIPLGREQLFAAERARSYSSISRPPYSEKFPKLLTSQFLSLPLPTS